MGARWADEGAMDTNHAALGTALGTRLPQKRSFERLVKGIVIASSALFVTGLVCKAVRAEPPPPAPPAVVHVADAHTDAVTPATSPGAAAPAAADAASRETASSKTSAAKTKPAHAAHKIRKSALR